MKTIIIATDFSAVAQNATYFAAAAASKKAYRVILFHLHNPSVHVLNSRSSVETIQDILNKKIEIISDIKNKLEKQHDIEVTAHVATGIFYEELEKCINNFNADLVVMGMVKKSLEQDLLGNSTTSAISKLKFPVLAIPEGVQFNGLKKMLFATDLVRGVHKEILNKVKDFVLDFKASVEVFHVRERIEESNDLLIRKNTEHIESELHDVPHYYKNVDSDKVILAIKDEIESLQADLLIMTPYKYGFWNSLLHTSKTKEMASGLTIPLLSLPL